MPDRDAISADTDVSWTIPWELLRRGEVEQGLQILREEYESRRTKNFAAREILRLGIAYLWAEMYESAAAHFTAAARRQFNGENDFAFAGIAEWQLGNLSVAIQRWREGLKAQYAVGCRVCSMTARFLVVASALEPDLLSKDEAEILLLNAIEPIDQSRWSGLLGRYFLGQVEATEVERWIENKSRSVEVKLPLLWQTDFYRAARELKRNEIDVEAFRRLMRPLADAVSSKEMDTATFSQFLRIPEYFFARTEAAKAG